MGVSKALPLALGTLAVAGTTAVVTFDIIFSVTLSNNDTPASSRITAIVASGIGAATIAITSALLGRQIRYRNGYALGNGPRHAYLLTVLGASAGVLFSVVSAVVLGMMQNRLLENPKKILGTRTNRVVLGGFVTWAIFTAAQALFIISMILVQRQEIKRAQRYSSAQPQVLSEMQEASRPKEDQSHSHYRGSTSMDSTKSPPPSSGRSRAGSDTMTSLRSSVAQVVRPITSKTKLINPRTHRPSSLASSNYSTHIEDGFDSWDTSTVDPQSRQAVEQGSPTPQRFLETIPASPTTSRSPSPGFPLDLEPPKTRRRSRSYSPAQQSPLPQPQSPTVSAREKPKSRTNSPTESTLESHIHPLFRTDSPTPPPAATPGTVVTAAPGAGTLISDRASIRRMRSGSLPSSPKLPSPLMHSDSLDSIRRTMLEEQTIEEEVEAASERTITPPIPQWIMEAGNRKSLTGYQMRKISQTRIGEAI